MTPATKNRSYPKLITDTVAALASHGIRVWKQSNDYVICGRFIFYPASGAICRLGRRGPPLRERGYRELLRLLDGNTPLEGSAETYELREVVISMGTGIDEPEPPREIIV